jgi:hypothetical protein
MIFALSLKAMWGGGRLLASSPLDDSVTTRKLKRFSREDSIRI